MLDLFGNHIVGFPTRQLSCILGMWSRSGVVKQNQDYEVVFVLSITVYFSDEPHYEKTRFLPMGKQRRRSDVQ